MKRLFCLLAFSLIIISCQLNPFIGVGTSVDTVAPILNIASPENFQYVSGKLLCIYGTCSDNQRVTSINLKAERNGELLFTWEIKNPVSPWSYSILLDSSADIKEQLRNNVAAADFRLPDGEYKFTVFAYDANGNSSTTSYDSRTLVVDNEPSVSEITYPPLKTSLDFYVGESSRGESEGADSYDFDNNEYFCNGDFYIQGSVDDNYGVAGVSITLTECNEDGEETEKKLTVSFNSSMEFKIAGNIEKHLLDVDTSKKVTSLWNWKVWFKESAKSEEDIKTPRYYKVNITVKDSAGNTESDEKGYFCVLPKTDYPYTIFPSYGEKIPVGTPLSGTCYDDDGIKSIKLSLCNTSGKTISGKEDFYDESIISNGNIFTWKMNKTIPTQGGSYLLKAEVIDINDKTSCYIVNANAEYLHNDEYREKVLNIVDLTAPSIEITAKKGQNVNGESIDFDVYSDVVDTNGYFQVAAKVSDAAQVRKVYMARVLNKASDEDVAKLSEVDAKTGNINCWDVSANISGIKFYNLYEYSGEEALSEVTASQVFNVFTDFENEFATKRFYVYAENASGKTTVSFKSLLREEDRPEITISSPTQGNTLTIPFEIDFLAEDFTGIKDLEITCLQGEKNIKTLTLEDLKESESFEKVGNEIKISKLSSEEFGGKDVFDSGSCSLTFTAKDDYGNTTLEKVQFYVEKDNPYIKSIIASKNVATYKANDVIPIRIEVNKSVIVSGGIPTLTLNNGGTAIYDKVDGNYIVFNYKVEYGHDTELLNCISLELNGATIADEQNMPLTVTNFPKDGFNSFAANATIKIDTISPTVSSIKSLIPNGAYKADDVIKIQVIFTENVDISIPDGKQLAMKLNIAGKERYAVYDGSEDGNSHNKAVFVYTVQEGDNVDVLSWTSWVADGVEITDSAVGAGGKGNAFAFSQTDIAYQWSSKLVIDTTAPQVSEVFSSFSSPKLELEGCYDETEKAYYCNAGKMITLTVAFSENVRVSDDSSLSLNLKGNNTTTAKYSSGSGTKNLTFSYTVVDGDSTEKDETLKVTVISGNITDNAGNRLLGINGSMTIGDGSGNEKKLIIDTTAPAAPVITASKNPNATDLVSYKDIYTEMKEGKTVGVTLKGTYTDSDIYSCCWVENGVAENFDTVSSEIVKTFGDGESEGFYQEYSIQLKLKDKAGNVSELSLPKVFIIDTDKPELTRASSSAVVNGELKTSVTRKYTEGEQIYISLVFNKHVTATDVRVKLNNGGIVSLAGNTTNIEGSKDYYLTGIYKVGVNEESAENLKIDSIVRGSVKDSLNNTLELSGISLNDIENIDDSQEIKIDSKAPYITEISSSKSNGWYTVGAIIPITVEFSESVELIDTPTLKLSLANGKTAIASYVSGSGKNSWIFNYEVKNGENTGDSSKDLSYLKAVSITGEIRDLAGTIKNGNRLVETIPAENFAGKKIGIDTTAPAALILKGVLSKKTEGGEVVEVGVENGKSYGGNKGTDFVTVSCNGGQESGAVFYVTKNGEVCGDWGDTFGSVQCKPDNGEILTYTINAKQRDKAGNISPEASITFTIDNSHPALESITTTHPNGTCTTGARIPLILKFNKRVEVTGTISVTLNAEDKSGNPKVLPISPTSTTSEIVKTVYEVAEGDITTEVLNVSTLTGVIKDELGNPLNLGEAASLSTATNLAATKQITIDTTPPQLTSITTTAKDGWYKAGDVIAVSLIFNEDVKVGETKEMLTLEMSSGGYAIYQSGNGQTMNFIYTVADGNATTSQNLKVSKIFSGGITDMAGNQWDASLPDNNFKDKKIGIDTAINDDIAITVGNENPDGKVYLETQTVNFSGLTDDGSGVKSVELTVNGVNKTISPSGEGKAAYTCAAVSGTSATYAVSVKMTDNAGNVSSKSVSFKIDGEDIILESITTPTASGTYNAGTEILVVLNFNKEVKVTTALTLTLTNGKTLTISEDKSYGKTKEVKYVVGSNDSGKSLDVESISGAVEDKRPKALSFSGEISADATTIADTRTINIDTEVPTIKSLTTSATGWYNVGKMIQITMACSEIVNVAEDATLSLSSGGKATYLSGSGSKNIVFVYNVAAGNSTAGNKQLTVSQVNGTIQDIALNDLSTVIPSHSFSCGIDTAAPKKLKIEGINNEAKLISANNLSITGFGENAGGSGIASYTVNINGTDYVVPGSVSDSLAFSNLATSITNTLTVADGGKQAFAIYAYQTDNAGNVSEKSDVLSFTIDTNKVKLIGGASSKSNETCKPGTNIDILLTFSRPVISGSAEITLSNGVVLSSGKWVDGGITFTTTYTVGSDEKEDTGNQKLTITNITGSVTDELATLDLNTLWTQASKPNLSTYNVFIDTKAPTGTLGTKYNEDGSATLTFEFSENVSKVVGKKIVLNRAVYAAPIVLSVNEYNEYYTLQPGIETYYEKTINGSDSAGNVDLTPKYVLKYEKEPTDSGLTSLFNNAGYYKQEIVMESSAVAVSGNKVTVAIPKENLMTGEEYTVEAEAGIVKDVVGNANVGVLSGSLETGDVPQPPVIRVNKISGRGSTAGTTTMKINTVTKDATVYYNSSNFTGYGTPSTEYDEKNLSSVTWRGTTYKGVAIGSSANAGKYWITAKATKNNTNTDSDLSYERAFKTVLKSKYVSDSNYFIMFRGGDVKSGSNTISGFPVTWDEKSVPSGWMPSVSENETLEIALAEYGMLLAGTVGTESIAITWGVPEKIYFHGLQCKKTGNKLLWKWQMNNAIEVLAGKAGKDNEDLEAKFHDRDGGNYD